MATAAHTPRRRRAGGPSHRSPAALVVGLLVLGGLIWGGLQSVELAGQQGGKGSGVQRSALVPAGQLVADQSLLDLVGQPDRFKAEIGGQAVGNDLRVVAVEPGEGFWVGTSDVRRVYVEYGADAGVDEATKGLPSVGDRVDLAGEVRPAPQNPERTLRLKAESAAQVKKQGAYVNADDWR